MDLIAPTGDKHRATIPYLTDGGQIMASIKDLDRRRTINPITTPMGVILHLLSQMPLASVTELTDRQARVIRSEQGFC